MQKLVIGMAAALALAWGHDARAAGDDKSKDAQQTMDQSRDQMKKDADQLKKDADKTADRAKEASKDAKADANARADARQEQMAASRDEKRGSIYSSKDNFEVKGKVQKVAGNSITVQRENLPEATLQVTHETKIELNGDKATLSQLQPGEDVKASFNLKGDKPEAVEIKADRKNK